MKGFAPPTVTRLAAKRPDLFLQNNPPDRFFAKSATTGADSPIKSLWECPLFRVHSYLARTSRSASRFDGAVTLKDRGVSNEIEALWLEEAPKQTTPKNQRRGAHGTDAETSAGNVNSA